MSDSDFTHYLYLLERLHMSKQHFLEFIKYIIDQRKLELPNLEEDWVVDLVEQKWSDEHIPIFIEKVFQGDVDDISSDVNRMTYWIENQIQEGLV